MTIDPEKLEVAHDPRQADSQIEVGRWMAVLDYELEGNVMVFTHTGVPRPLEGQGVGARLAKTDWNTHGSSRTRSSLHASSWTSTSVAIRIQRPGGRLDLSHAQ